MSMEREPDGLAGTGLPGERKTVVLARDEKSGVAIGLCERVARPAFVNGELRLLPYLGALRVAASHRNKIGVLKGGFRALAEHGTRPGECPFALTAITIDNAPARRILTAGLPALPRYQRVSDYLTFVFPTKRRQPVRGIERASDAALCHLAALQKRSASRYLFAPAWEEAALRVIGAENLLLYRAGGEIAGCVGVWDQSAFKQTVARGYPAALSFARPLINILAQFTGKPQLPAVGASLRLVYLSALSVADERVDILLPLLRAALDLATSRGAGAAVLGMDARHPWTSAIRGAFGAMEYRTEIFCVGDDGHAPQPRTDRLTMLDVGLV